MLSGKIKDLFGGCRDKVSPLRFYFNQFSNIVCSPATPRSFIFVLYSTDPFHLTKDDSHAETCPR